MKNSNISWCDHTINLWWGCSKVHLGCDNCYAEYFSDVRHKNNLWGKNSFRKEVKSCFRDLTKFEKLGKITGIKQKVFVGSMMDIFENSKPMIFINGNPILSKATGGEIPITTNHVRNLLFDLIDRKKFENIIFLFLTKRPSNISKFIPENWKESLPQNVWFGTSISTQENANTLVPLLINHSPKNSKLFLSVEPQLERLKLDLWYNSINWVIQGGESGVKRRNFNIQWAYDMCNFCLKFKIPYFFKQIDGKLKIPEDLMINQFPKF